MANRKIEDSKLTAIANAIRNKLMSTVSMTPDEMPDMISSIGIGVVPSYWKTYLENKATEINNAINAASANRSTFLWYTDAHWAINHGSSPVLLKYLSKHTDMKKTFYGGDISNATSGEIEMLTAWKELVKDIPNHHSVLGNHDNQVTDLPSGLSDFFIEPERTGDVVYGTDVTNGKNYYYIDNHIENTRYICLSTGRMWTYADELTWCIEALNSTPNGWHIVVISHLWLNNDYDNGGIITTPENYTKVYLDLFDAYNYRESGTTEMHSVSYNFADAKAKVEFVIGGHVHQDYDFATAKGIPIILTECDAWQERDDVSVATKGTTTESCVYAIVADYDAKSVKVINVGRGDSRTVEIPDVVIITYTNLLPIATNPDGSIYNGIGYKPSTRLSVSSGSFEERTESGWCTTGVISAKDGDVVRLKNCVFKKSNASGTHRGGVYFAKSDGSYSGNMVSMGIINDLNPVYDTDGDNIVQFTIPTSAKCACIRIVAQEFNANSIITANEEIG